MDYKKLLKSRRTRQRMLAMLSWIPDSVMLKIQYRIKFGRKLDLEKPQRFTEKMQWYKLNYKNPTMIQCVDKYDVRSYIESKGLSDILVHAYGAYSNVNEIDFESLPNRFVLKDTLGSGGNSVIICDKSESIYPDSVIDRVTQWVNRDAHIKEGGREWPYYEGKQPRILVEDYIEPENKKIGLVDYKFFCFNGKVEFIYAMCERKLGSSIKVGIFDRSFRKLNVSRVGDPDLPVKIEKPDNFERMVKIAELLSAEFPHVRVDLYNNEGIINFGELTFYNASGYMKYDPDEFDYEIGKVFDLRSYDEYEGVKK